MSHVLKGGGEVLAKKDEISHDLAYCLVSITPRFPAFLCTVNHQRVRDVHNATDLFGDAM